MKRSYLYVFPIMLALAFGSQQPSSLGFSLESQKGEETLQQEIQDEGKDKENSTTLSEEWTNSIGMKFRLIPAGEFWMGAVPGDGEALDDEKPRHRVEITKPFYLGVYEVTQEQWERVKGPAAGGNPPTAGGLPLEGLGPSYPAYYVSWEEAVAFCEKLSEMEGVSYRLPTEEEWEYACRAGTETLYNWGNDGGVGTMKQYSWYRLNSMGRHWVSPHAEREGPQPVGRKLPNAWGLYDMSGNVSEWCNDFFTEDYYSHSPVEDPGGPEPNRNRVRRGGSWLDKPWHMRASNRASAWSTVEGDDIGFRIVREIR